MRQFAVLGLGTFGHYAALTLAESKAEVLVVDADENAVQKIKDLVAQAVVGDVSDRSMLEQMGIQNIDCVLVNLGNRLDASILTTLHLKEMGVKEIVVKAISDEHERALYKIGATKVVYPEKHAGINTAKSLTHPNFLDYIPLEGGYSIVEVVPQEAYIGKTIQESQLRNNFDLNILAITVPQGSGSKERKMVFPLPSYKIKTDDRLLIMGTEENIQRFQKV